MPEIHRSLMIIIITFIYDAPVPFLKAPSTSLLEIRWETLGYDDQLSVIAVVVFCLFKCV